MPKTHPRRNAREGVLQALYAQQFSEEKTTITLDRILDESPVRKKNNKFILALYYSVLEHHDWTDEMIKKHLQNWEFDRVAQVDRVLLRMGICEIFFMDDIPPKVTISEMVEIAKVYSTEESSGFINGILDAVFKEFQKQEKN
jgi:N utilization substance protein B